MSISPTQIGQRVWSTMSAAVQRGYDFASRITGQQTSDYKLSPPTIEALLEKVPESERLPKQNFYYTLIKSGLPHTQAASLVEKTLFPPGNQLKFYRTIHSDKGLRKGPNEDRFFFVDDQEYLIAGVCDGHGDSEAKVAEKVSREFPTILKKRLNIEGDVATKFHNACQEMEERVIQFQKGNFRQWSSISKYVDKQCEDASYTLLLGGCTMVCLLIQKELNRAYVCTLGDSEARLGVEREIYHASCAQSWGNHHDFERAKEWYLNEAEKEVLVLNNGAYPTPDWAAFYTQYHYGRFAHCRVRGYNVSRSFGDKGYTSSGELKESQPTSTTPIVTEIPLIPSSRILIASDGYFNFVSDSETADLLHQYRSAQDIADKAFMNQRARATRHVDWNYENLSPHARQHWYTNSGDNITTLTIDVDKA